ncbi:hypothetical protein HanXRQr2_Chr11g0504441 [Helianthus annuus]|uniref:Uncharacterized protein n=1 Tax=Helianthus annuus TaxID=4232 RepID=A0A9K3HRI9_HELAN|nr:hypothetical protein HanXRQr2_Chr11g0504441 [Helianthus annuus]
MTSDARRVMYSEPSAPLKSFPANFEYRTVLPGDNGTPVLFPSSFRGPGPTAITCASKENKDVVSTRYNQTLVAC